MAYAPPAGADARFADLAPMVPLAGWERVATAPVATLFAAERRTRYGKLRVYADTSVIGGCEDEEFREASRLLIQKCRRGEMTLVVSSLTYQELEDAPHRVQEVLESVGDADRDVIGVTEEVKRLAGRYVEAGALTHGIRADAEHIAAATVAGVDRLASWNFRHMVNPWRIRRYNEVNRRMGHSPVRICTPQEIHDEE